MRGRSECTGVDPGVDPAAGLGRAAGLTGTGGAGDRFVQSVAVPGGRRPRSRTEEWIMYPGLEYSTVMDIDVEQSGGRGNTPSLLLREALFGAVEQAVGESGIAWHACRLKDLGDGLRLIVPAEVPKARLVHPLAHQLAARLRAHNRLAGPATRIRVRMALHAGELHHGPGGMTGRPLEVVARLLDCGPLRGALAAVPDATVAVILSRPVYDDAVPHGYPGIEPEAFHRVTVSVKETTTEAWLYFPDHQVFPAEAKPREVEVAGGVTGAAAGGVTGDAVTAGGVTGAEAAISGATTGKVAAGEAAAGEATTGEVAAGKVAAGKVAAEGALARSQPYPLSDAEIDQRARSAGQALLGAMGTDAWAAARLGLVALLDRANHPRRAALADQLDGNAALVRTAAQPDAARLALLGLWALELSALLRDYPECRGPLEELAVHLNREQQRSQPERIVQHITASAPGSSSQGVVNGSIYNRWTPCAEAAGPPERARPHDGSADD
ncbi:hypothetical protein [Streptacidiphilus cavernicola]|uniref:Uncharacterized protein n=1 Tax=Streptacidiphilus cavernicola TaxID=3342716 RepID=A0ABV6VZH1_9ACTN